MITMKFSGYSDNKPRNNKTVIIDDNTSSDD